MPEAITTAPTPAVMTRETCAFLLIFNRAASRTRELLAVDHAGKRKQPPSFRVVLSSRTLTPAPLAIAGPAYAALAS